MASKRPKKRSTASRKRLPRRKGERGPAPGESAIGLDDPRVAEVVDRVRRSGGAVLAAYADPLSGKPLVSAMLPLSAITPTPFQRELSPTHAKRLAAKIEECGVFLDPLIAVASPEDGGFWTPNGRHRLAAAQALGQRSIVALISPEPALAFRILALNTEKAHNLRDRSLEVIRMARALAAEKTPGTEADRAAELESPAFLTLGILYEKGRFSGGAYLPLLRKVERFEDQANLRVSLRAREGWASRLAAIDEQVSGVIERLRQRGFRSPYLRPFVVARVNPVRWLKVKPGAKKPPMPLPEALTRMTRSLRDFKIESVKPQDLALVAAVSSGDESD